MATATHATTIYDTSAFTATADNLVKWPVYADDANPSTDPTETTVIDKVDATLGYGGKEKLIRHLQRAIASGPSELSVIIRRLSHTDTSTWTDKGSRAL